DASYDDVTRVARRASAAARRELVRDGIPARGITVRAWVRVRYLGQSIELEVPLARDFRGAFDRMHMRLLHTANPARSIEVTAVKVSAIANPAAGIAKVRRRRASAKAKATPRVRVPVWVDGRIHATAVYDRAELESGALIRGPAIVTEYSSTLLVAHGWALTVDGQDNLRLQCRRNRHG